MFVLPSGNLFDAGPNEEGLVGESTFPSYLFKWNLNPPVWQQLPASAGSEFDGGTAVMFRPGEIMKCGGEDEFGAPVVGMTKKIKINAQDQVVGSGWVTSDTSVTKMVPRVYNNTTILPTGDVVTTGGLVALDAKSNGVRPAQIWKPYGGTDSKGVWTDTLAADSARRGYHSTAILLPDGRVLSAGGETSPDYQKPTIYCPPYLFDSTGALATRPAITSAPDTVNWGRPFTICTDQQATAISSVCLIRPGAVTHAFNQDQRFVPLPIVACATTQLVVEAPADSNIAPPGYYLIFVVENGVPSVGRWTQVMSYPAWDDCDAVRPDDVIDLAVATGRTTATVSWRATGDDSLCGTADEFDLRVSTSGSITEANFYSATRLTTPTPGPPGTLHCVELSGLSSCTWYYFALKTRDNRYSWSAISNGASGKTKCTGTIELECGESGLFAQSGGGSGSWVAENTLLGELGGSQAIDLYRLQGAAGPAGGRYGVRLAKHGTGRADLDEVRLGSVDHDPSVGAVAGLDRAYLGTTSAVASVTDHTGADVAAQVSGASDHPYAGEAGASLTVDLGGGGSSNTALVIEWAGYVPGVAADSTGIVVQKPEGGGGWQTIAQLRPRRTFNRVAVDAEGSATLRLAFLGDHQVRRVERMSVSRTENPEWPTLASAQHSRLGDVTSAVGSSGGTTTRLLPDDWLTLSYDATVVPSGNVRTLMLLTRGAYTARGAESRGSGSLSPATSLVTFETSLGPAQPNPGPGEVRIGYTLAREAVVQLSLYDVAGRRVRVLERGLRPAGAYEVVWDGRNEEGAPARPGVYLYRMTTDGWTSQRKLVVYARSGF